METDDVTSVTSGDGTKYQKVNGTWTSSQPLDQPPRLQRAVHFSDDDSKRSKTPAPTQDIVMVSDDEEEDGSYEVPFDEIWEYCRGNTPAWESWKTGSGYPRLINMTGHPFTMAIDTDDENLQEITIPPELTTPHIIVDDNEAATVYTGGPLANIKIFRIDVGLDEETWDTKGLKNDHNYVVASDVAMYIGSNPNLSRALSKRNIGIFSVPYDESDFDSYEIKAEKEDRHLKLQGPIFEHLIRWV